MLVQESDYLFDTHFSLATKAIHTKGESNHGAVNSPIYLSSTFEMKAPGELVTEYYYTRCGNPTTDSFNQAIAALENNTYGLSFSSGTAAMVTILGLLSTKDEILSCDDIYGGNQSYFRNVAHKKHGITVNFIDMTDVEKVKQSVTKDTKMLWIETPTNPTLKLVDIQALCQIAKENNLISVVDNTFCSPYLQTPKDLGADITVNSGTKYLGGHSDIIFGTLTCSDKNLYDQLKFLSFTFGGCPSPQDSYLMLRSIKTLEIRVKQQVKNAYCIAKYLEQHKAIEKVLYPGLRSHPQYELARKQMRGGGAMISFYVKGTKEDTIKFINGLKLFTLAVSLGGPESLIEMPALMTHANVPEDHRGCLGIKDNFIRMSTGLEHSDDLIEDLEQALRFLQ